MESRFHDIDDPTPGTCNWLLHHETYKTWIDDGRDVLWIQGKPGSGKSTLLRHVVDQTQKAAKSARTGFVLSFFFHGRGTELQKTPLGLFRSLLYQLLSQVPDAAPPGMIAAFRDRCRTVGQPGAQWNWHPKELQRSWVSALESALARGDVWLFIDGLDEAGEDAAVDVVELTTLFLDTLAAQPSPFRLRVCFASRHDPRLHDGGALQVNVEDENRDDISVYLRARLPGSVLSGAQISVQDLITERSSGIFSWAQLAVKKARSLKRDGASPEAIAEEIGAMPTDLEDSIHHQQPLHAPEN